MHLNTHMHARTMSTPQHSMRPNSCDSQVINFNSSETSTDTKIKINSQVETSNTPMPAHRVIVDHEDVRVLEHQSNDNAGIFITWEDLWVTVSDIKGRRRPIVQGLTGYAQPGEVLAVMGPSGCGKTTLLDALAGRLGANTRHTGDILINGRKQALAYGTSAYVTQDETLIATLTVIEAVYYSAQFQLPNSMSKSEKKERAENTIREMGLKDCMNTRIGGWGNKGLSGGQKRRVSICIGILTHPKLLFLDEPTSGLDSAASYYVMRRITQLEQRERRTIITSIHQPSSEVFELFDKLCILSMGRVVYFGPASTANEFFTSNGFICPALRNPSDQFLRIVNTDFDEQETECGSTGKVAKEEMVDSLVTAYESSESHQRVKRQVSDICKKGGGSLEKSRSHASFFTQCLVLTKRSFVNMFRDLGYYWLRLAIYIAIALSLGTIYYDVGTSYNSIQPRGALLTFVASLLTFMAIGGFPSFVEDMKVFEVERLNGHYGATAFVIGNTVSSVPYLLLISLIPGALAYYLAGLRRGFEPFVYFDLVLFTCMILVESLMMTVASLVQPNFLMGIIAGGGVQGLMMLGSGFFRLPGDLPKLFWKYPVYYIAFHKYAYQGLYKNDYEGLHFSSGQAGGLDVIVRGEEVLRDELQVEMGYSKWVDLGILVAMVVVYRVLFLVIIKMVENFKPVIRKFISVKPQQMTRVMENPTA